MIGMTMFVREEIMREEIIGMRKTTVVAREESIGVIMIEMTTVVGEETTRTIPELTTGG